MLRLMQQGEEVSSEAILPTLIGWKELEGAMGKLPKEDTARLTSLIERANTLSLYPHLKVEDIDEALTVLLGAMTLLMLDSEDSIDDILPALRAQMEEAEKLLDRLVPLN